jgi:solute carrier family 45 protein 1/2/4
MYVVVATACVLFGFEWYLITLQTHCVAVDHQPDTQQPMPRLSPFQFFRLSVSFLGVQFGWGLQIAFTSPLFLTLGVSHTLVSLIWLAGPISGFIVQPTVGAISDGWYTRYGRRSPFILAGGFCITLGLGLIGNAQLIAEDGNPNLAIAIAVFGFWILDLSNNTVQGPCRALLVDVAPPEQQGEGSAWFSFMLGTGSLLAYFIGSFPLLKIVPFMQSQYQALFTLSMIVLTVCLVITLTSIKEVPPPNIPGIENPFKMILKKMGQSNMPPAVTRVCVVQFFSWIAWFTFLLFITTWVGEDVFGGDPTAEAGTDLRTKFNDGVQYGSRALSYQALLTMVMSLVLPKIVRFTGYRFVYFVSNMILAGCLVSTYWIKTTKGATSVIAVSGIPWTVTMILPFAIVGQAVETCESGLYMGVMNIFVVLPQMLVSLLLPGVITLFHHKIVSALITGGFFAIIAAFCSLRLIMPRIQVQEVDSTTQPLLGPPTPQVIGYSANT